MIPTPSKTARRQAQPIAEFRIDRGPATNKLVTPLYNSRIKVYLDVPLTANDPPVKNPAIIALPLITIQDQQNGLGIGTALPWIFFLSYTFHSTIISTK